MIYEKKTRMKTTCYQCLNFDSNEMQKICTLKLGFETL